MVSIIYAILLVFSLLYLVELPVGSIPANEYEKGMTMVLMLVLASIIVLIIQNMLSPRNKRNEKVGVFSFFLIAYLCVHFQTFTNMMVFDDYVDNFNVYNDKVVNLRTALVSLVGLEAYLLGNSIFLSKKNNIQLDKFRVMVADYKVLRKRTDFFLLMSVLLFFVLNGKTYLAGAYSQEMLNSMSGTMNAYSGILVELLLYSAIILKIYSTKEDNKNISVIGYLKSFSALFYISITIYLGLVVISGDRGPLISFVLSMAFGYIMITKRRFRWITLIMFFVVGGLFISVMGIARADRSGGSYNLQNNEYVLTILNLNSVFPFTEELAGSNRTAIWAVESTPSEYPFRYGLFSLNHILGIIPFSGKILNTLGININGSNHYGHSASFLDWYTQGDNVTAGVGTSTVADIYLDFGVPGIVIVLFIIGMFYSKLDKIIMNYQSLNVPIFTMITCLVFFSGSVYLARASILPQFRNIVWLYILLYFIFQTGKSRKLLI